MRVLAINDVSCVGKCSLTVSLPIISACGITCDVLPTALLSTHTGGFTGYTFHSLTEEIPAIVKHWKSLGLRYDYIYSGYLGDVQQIAMVKSIKDELLKPDGKFIVDPVMGDDGKLYDNFNDEYVDKMRELCKEAHFVLPNLTEACLLTKTPYSAQNSERDWETLVRDLSRICHRSIVTGIVQNESIFVYYMDENSCVQRIASENVQGFFHGSGDVFASAFVGALARGKNEDNAIRLSSDFVSASIRRTAKAGTDTRFGLAFEEGIFTFLQNVNQ